MTSKMHIYVSQFLKMTKRVMPLWEGCRYQFLLLRFDLAPTPYVLTSFLKILMTHARRIRMRITTCLVENLVFGRKKEKSPTLRDTDILFLRCLGFVTNQKKQEQSLKVFCKKKVFLKVSEISQENTCPEVSF